MRRTEPEPQRRRIIAVTELQPDAGPALTVYFDGGCPICAAEIGTYRRLKAREPVIWLNVADSNIPIPQGVTREALLARFHVRGSDGTLISGGRAFLWLWSALPGWRYLGALKSVPGVPLMADLLYALFLRLRPALQAIAARVRPREGRG